MTIPIEPGEMILIPRIDVLELEELVAASKLSMISLLTPMGYMSHPTLLSGATSDCTGMTE